MTDAALVELARAAHLRPTRDVDGTAHVVGKFGDVCAYGAGRLAWCLFGANVTAKRLRALMRAHVPGLLTVEQEGDEEAVFTFAPEDLVQVARLAGCRFRRVLSDEHRAALAASGALTRFQACSDHGSTGPHQALSTGVLALARPGHGPVSPAAVQDAVDPSPTVEET